jgi:hypothetical protein
MDKDKAKTLRDKLSIALRGVEVGLGVKINVGVINYSDTDFNIRLTGVDSVAGADNFLEAEFLTKCGKYDLRMEDLGRLVRINGNVHKIIGLKVRNRKYPIITQRQDNKKQYKLTARQVTEAIRSIDGTR